MCNSLAFAKQKYKEYGMELLATSFRGQSIPMPYKCMICEHEGVKPLSKVGITDCYNCSRKRVGGKLKKDISQIKVDFAKKNLKLLSKNYSNVRIPLKYECMVCGYKGQKCYATLEKTGCMQCSWSKTGNALKHNPSIVEQNFKDRKLKMLSNYVDSIKKIEFQCLTCEYKGYISYQVLMKSKKNKTACKKCKREILAKKQRMPFNHVKKIFVALNLTLKSKKNDYISGKSELEYQCKGCKKLGSISFFNLTRRLKRGMQVGCKYCLRNIKGEIRNFPLSLDDVKERFLSKNLLLLEDKYINNKQRLKFKCLICSISGITDVQNISKPNSIPCNACRSAYKKQPILTLEDVNKRFNQIGLKLISTEFKSSRSKLKFECLKCGKEGETTLGSIRLSSGCRNCGVNKTRDKLKLAGEEVHHRCLTVNIKLISPYYGASTPIMYKCMKCNFIGITSLANVSVGRGCAPCGRKMGQEHYKMYRQFKIKDNISEILKGLKNDT